MMQVGLYTFCFDYLEEKLVNKLRDESVVNQHAL
jgi:hypothetical protein